MSSLLPLPSQTQTPILIKDRRPLYRGFLLGICVVLVALGGYYVAVLNDSGSLLTTVPSGDDEQAILAIARAEQINQAAVAYVQSCGAELAADTWREAETEQARYELLSSFIAFSPESLSEYMPEEYEIVLWDEIGRGDRDDKARLVAGGMVLDY